MTPVIFISFVVSLSLVDLRHSANRSNYHAEPEASRLPRWLHRIIYRYRRYEYVPVGDHVRPVGERAESDSFYHSKQRKLMKMEAAEAFEIRSTVLVILALVSLCVLWGFWSMATWFYRHGVLDDEHT